ncbi:hypothetical protein J5N97_025209 [Dioscorea zingiberensis]|uniref:Major facilitator superfamily (MFS) profile domain-containing protein n=1 Tax=Dioscorea zingiberensis TaxID=325984 RepID=A0A9D5C9C5_9LILI|nr:hypothetical protein J5N97_025209 [Dioscorea zingiberensis]
MTRSLEESFEGSGKGNMEEELGGGGRSEEGACNNSHGRLTPYVILSCLLAATGGVLFGYDLGISGGVTSMEPFLKKFFPEVYTKMKEDLSISNYCKFDSQLLTTFTSSLYIAGLFASFLASSVTRVFGRRASMLAGGAAFLAGGALGGAATNIYMLILGRVLLGVGIGFTNQSVPVYLSEMAPPEHRGAINNGFEVCVGLGVLFANLINYATQKISSGWGWRLSLALAVVPATPLTLGAMFLPETPNSIIQRNGDIQHARKVLQRIRGIDNVDAELNDIIFVCNNVSKRDYKQIMQRKYRPQLVMAFLIPFFQQVTGINVVTFYVPLLFRTIGLGESASLMSTVVTGVVGTGSIIVAMVLVDRLGRRELFLIGGVQMLVSQVVIGAVMAAELGDHGGMSTGYTWIVLVVICVYVAGFGLSWGPLAWLVPSEIFPLEIRSTGQSIVVGVGFVFIFVIAQSFLSMLCHLKSGIFFFFGGWVLVMTLFTYFFMPETKNIHIEKMERVWREHWFWKKIVRDEE